MSIETVKIPDVGGGEVEVIELNVAVGDVVEIEQTLVVLESDKASMEIPSPVAGTVTDIKLAEGDKVSEGADFILVELEGAGVAESSSNDALVEPVVEPEPSNEVPEAVVAAPVSSELDVAIPDIGGEAEVIELSVSVGDVVAAEDILCVLESDKASMEVPAPEAGTIIKLHIKEGDKVSEGMPMLLMQVDAAPVAVQPSAPVEPAVSSEVSSVTEAVAAPQKTVEKTVNKPSGEVYAGPVVRKLARELGVDLSLVVASGPRGRLQKEDLHSYVQQVVQKAESGAVTGGSGIPPIPDVDFSAFGSVSIEPMSKIQKLTAANMQRSWLNVPHVTQFDDVDISDLEDFRKSMKADAADAGVKLTPLPFLLKACASALRKNPIFNSSLDGSGENLVYKNYVHIGIAVDTPAGLMVPVIRDVDKKGLYELAKESVELATAAKNRKLKPADMKGGCFTISSLGGMGGKGFTPIVNPPEVGILGVSRLSVQPVWNGNEFVPRKMLPLSLSYDHRVVNGGDAGRFFADLSAYLTEVRRLLL